MFTLSNKWTNILSSELNKDYYINLISFVKEEYSNKTIFPEKELVFNAFDKCDFDDIKVVILGQDPYHTPGAAHGLAFSVPDGEKIPPSLRNIFKEINEDLNKEIPTSGNLEKWAKQGVFMINATLTVEAHKAGSHQKKGWEQFTDAVIKKIADERENIVFLLWGSYAQKKANLIDDNKHCILKSVHPSPLSAYRGFFGCKHFSKTNEYLESKNIKSINW
ncbi:MAG: uracil-DNA glycosylase [Marinifilaceae bacterium]|jgi:uracil-DNA glycosylase|nr:uracil-DNA glycosylase [Marinifilaceae bacterium]